MRFVTGWYSRGYLPHFDDGLSLQCLTYRLGDALPSDVVARLRDLAADGGKCQLEIERCLAAGHGSCLLRIPQNAQIIVDNWRRFEDVRYHLHAWVVMPNHVHVLIEPLACWPLARIVQSWKSYTAKQIIPQADASAGRLWQPDYWDRFIRNGRHYLATVDYIHQNPVNARLCARPGDWLWSSAYSGSADGPSAGK
jgi:REP element-mobilizing transposase RayT